MADYWKSQPRKFCQYCKCWIADNKPSIDFHERGKNHKENVAAKIAEIKKKSVDKAKQEARVSKEFAAMEEAAMKAYEEDLKRMAGGPVSAPQPTIAIKPPPRVITHTKKQLKQLKKAEKAKKKLQQQTEAQVWVEGQSEDGNTYYYNTVTGESQWETPEGFQRESSSGAHPGQTQSSSSCPWMEAVSPEGYTYFYNSETGESSWEKPAGFPSNEASKSGTSKAGEEEPSSPEAESPSAVEESSNGAPASKEDEAPEPVNQQPKVPKINFRKRKAETEPSEKEGDDASKEDVEEVKKEDEVQSTTAESEEKKADEKKQEKQATQGRKQAKKPKVPNPYGAWEQIKQEEDPYAKVDLQLPRVAGNAMVSATIDLPPEPKIKFKERVITSLGDGGGPASFKKSKTHNGKSRSLRQRDDDD